MRLFGLIFLLAISLQTLSAEDASQTAPLLKGAQEMADAFQKGDVAKILDQTYDPIIKSMGGREKAIQEVGKGMKAMKSKISDMKYSVETPGPFQTVGKETFAVVPTTLEMTLKDIGTIRSKGYLLGVSPDNGKTWKYLDGAGLKAKGERQKVLPGIHEKLILPEWQAPEIIKMDS